MYFLFLFILLHNMLKDIVARKLNDCFFTIYFRTAALQSIYVTSNTTFKFSKNC